MWKLVGFSGFDVSTYELFAESHTHVSLTVTWLRTKSYANDADILVSLDSMKHPYQVSLRVSPTPRPGPYAAHWASTPITGLYSWKTTELSSVGESVYTIWIW